ncbi:FIG00469824: hypothetical protein [hydrothermal vent metagenome]|uniref:Uncharacterized protein n=1 Tax=hydrothermal vent metagenome TaxID=652676 RepID=A0A1W1C1F2_9ZZZZ
MENIRFVKAPLKIKFEEISGADEKYKREFDQLVSSDEDSIGQWLKLAKARGETGDSDQVLLNLIVELHRKIDDLSAFIKNEKPSYLKLAFEEDISEIGFEHFKLLNFELEKDKRYYARIPMPVFPKREFALFFKAIDKNIAQIVLMHELDIKDWSSYMSARERVMIREAKALKGV